MNSKYAEGKSYGYVMFIFYTNSIQIRVSYRTIPVKRYSSTKSSLYLVLARPLKYLMEIFVQPIRGDLVQDLATDSIYVGIS